MSPTCCWPAQLCASAIWRSARRSARGAGVSSRQVMGETLVLGLAGGVTGLALAWALLRVFVTQAPASFPRLAAIDLDLPVLLFSFVVAVVAAAMAGLAPAVNLVRADLNTAVRSGSGRAVTAHRARRASRLLVVSEVALALALVTTAGLMTRSLLRLQIAGYRDHPRTRVDVCGRPASVRRGWRRRRPPLPAAVRRTRPCSARRVARFRHQHAAGGRHRQQRLAPGATTSMAMTRACRSPRCES